MTITWKDFTVEPWTIGEESNQPAVALVCRYDDACEWADICARGRLFTLGQLQQLAEAHIAEHQRDEDEDQDLAAFLDAKIRFWRCPEPSHRDRSNANGLPTVEWRDNIAHCTAPDCGRTSRNTTGPSA